jgi:hypothetical protein
MNRKHEWLWDRFDLLPIEAKQMIWYSPDEPTPDMLLVVEELADEALSQEKPKINANQHVRLLCQNRSHMGSSVARC